MTQILGYPLNTSTPLDMTKAGPVIPLASLVPVWPEEEKILLFRDTRIEGGKDWRFSCGQVNHELAWKDGATALFRSAKTALGKDLGMCPPYPARRPDAVLLVPEDCDDEVPQMYLHTFFFIPFEARVIERLETKKANIPFEFAWVPEYFLDSKTDGEDYGLYRYHLYKEVVTAAKRFMRTRRNVAEDETADKALRALCDTIRNGDEGVSEHLRELLEALKYQQVRLPCLRHSAED